MAAQTEWINIYIIGGRNTTPEVIERQLDVITEGIRALRDVRILTPEDTHIGDTAYKMAINKVIEVRMIPRWYDLSIWCDIWFSATSPDTRPTLLFYLKPDIDNEWVRLSAAAHDHLISCYILTEETTTEAVRDMMASTQRIINQLLSLRSDPR